MSRPFAAICQALFLLTLTLVDVRAAHAAANRWGAIGVPGNAIQSIETEPGTPTALWAVGFETVYRSTDGGATWQLRMNGLRKDSALHLRSIVLDSSQPGTALLMTNFNLGLWRTTDSGASWTLVAGPRGWSDQLVVEDPFAPGTFYLGSHGAMLRSTDHGATWQPVGVAPTSGTYDQAVEMAADPFVPGRIYLVSSDPNSATTFLITSDYGASWQVGGAGLPGFFGGPLRVAADASHTLYFGNGALYLSHDGGMSWQASSLAIPHAYEIILDPTNPAVAYVLGDDEQIARTADSGATWQTINGHLPGLATYYVYSLAVDPADAARLWIGTSGFGVLTSTNSGQTWQVSSAGMGVGNAGCRLAIAASTDTLYTVAGNVLWKSADDGATWIPISPELTPDAPFPRVIDFVLDPSNEDTVYAATIGDGVFTSHDGGSSWSASSVGLSNLSTSAIGIDPVQPQILYASGQGGLFRSTDGAASWSLQNMSLANVAAIDVDPTQPATLYFSGGAWKSSDSGSTYAATPPLLEVENSPGSTYQFNMSLAIDPTAQGRAYVSLHAFNVISIQPFSGTAFAELDLSTDHLDTTTQLSSVAASALAVDPDDSAIVYAGRFSSGQIERSLDHAASFQPLGSSIYPAVACTIRINPNNGNIYAASYTNLYELTPAACTTNADCDNSNPCMANTCSGGLCIGALADGVACTVSAGCGISGTCTGGACLNNVGSCDDGNACTADFCAISDYCVHNAIPDCTPCSTELDCDDGDGCTSDQCNYDGTCLNPPIHCSDSDPCTVDSCNAGQCEFAVDLSMCLQATVLEGRHSKLVVKTHGDQVELKFRSRDAGLAAAPGSYADPTIAGLGIDIFNPDGSTTHFDVPAGAGIPGWSINEHGNDAEYDYENAMSPDGPSPVESVRQSPRMLQIKAAGGAVLPGASATAVGIRITVGNQMWCGLLQSRKPSSAQRFVGDLGSTIPDCTDASLMP